MAIASSDRTLFRRSTAAESSWGETPASPAMTEQNATSVNMNSGKTTVNSPEIRSDRMLTDIVQTGFDAAGDFGIAMRYGEHEWAFESLFGSTFGNAQSLTGAGASDDFSFEADPYNAIRGPGLEAFEVGQWIEVSGAAQSGNNGRFRVSGKNTNIIVVNGPLTTEDSSTANIKSDGRLKLGTTEISYMLEQEFNDITQFKYVTGARISQIALNITNRQVITGTCNFMGKQLFRAATTTGGASAAANTNTLMNASTNVGAISKDYVALSTALLSLNVTINGSLRALPQIGASANAAIADGTFDISGQVNAYFEDATLYTLALDHTTTALSWEMSDDAGNRYVFTLPAIKLTGDPNAPGQNQDIQLNLDFSALRDAASDTMIEIEKFNI